MIRSLVIPVKLPAEALGSQANVPLDPTVLRRNLSRDGLEACLAEGCDMWIDIVDPTPDEIHWLAGLLQLSAVVVSDLLREDRRPTLVVNPSYLFLSLFQPYVQGNSLEGKEIHCIVGENFCVTVRKSNASALEEAYDRVAQDPDSWQRGVAYFLYLSAQHIIDTYYPVLDRISNQLNELEEKLLNDSDAKQAHRSVYRIKQHLIGLRQLIAPQREVLSNLMGEKRISGNSDIRDLFRHLYERLLGIYDVIDAQRDLTSNVLDIIANQHSHMMGEAVNRLTIISLVFLPFTFLLGLFDADFFRVDQSISLPVNGLAISAVITLLMAGSMLVTRAAFRKRGWT